LLMHVPVKPESAVSVVRRQRLEIAMEMGLGIANGRCN